MPNAVEHIIVDGVESKRCCMCGEIVPISEFYVNKCRRDGFQTYCKPCALKWKRGHKDLINKLNRASKSRHKESVSAYNVAYAKNKYKTNIAFRLKTIMSANINQSLRGKKNRRSWSELVGYTVDDLRKELTKKMLPGMTWENYGEWHIDHIIPITAFNIDSYNCIDFKKCWSLSNLRPLWRLDNLLKYNKLDKPFQPSLAIAI